MHRGTPAALSSRERRCGPPVGSPASWARSALVGSPFATARCAEGCAPLEREDRGGSRPSLPSAGVQDPDLHQAGQVAGAPEHHQARVRDVQQTPGDQRA